MCAPSAAAGAVDAAGKEEALEAEAYFDALGSGEERAFESRTHLRRWHAELPQFDDPQPIRREQLPPLRAAAVASIWRQRRHRRRCRGCQFRVSGVAGGLDVEVSLIFLRKWKASGALLPSLHATIVAPPTNTTRKAMSSNEHQRTTTPW